MKAAPSVLGLHWDDRQALAALAALGQRFPVAVARGLNRTATSERAVMAPAIARDMALKVGRVKQAINIEKASAGRLVARIVARGARIPLVDFGARGPEPSRGRGKGVSAKLPGGRGRYPTAFLARMKSGHRGVFQRVGTQRTPIYELFGPSIVKVFEKHVPLGEARRSDVLVKNVQHAVAFAMSRLQQ